MSKQVCLSVYSSDDYFILYKLSYMWYVVIGFLVTLLVGIIISHTISWCSKEPATVCNPDLFSPLVQSYVKRRYQTKTTVDGEDDVSLTYKCGICYLILGWLVS
jgi:hypothetical protein